MRMHSARCSRRCSEFANLYLLHSWLQDPNVHSTVAITPLADVTGSAACACVKLSGDLPLAWGAYFLVED